VEDKALANHPIRIATPLVVATMIIVAALAITMIFLAPESLWAWIVAMMFLPVAMTGLFVFIRRSDSHKQASKIGGDLRAGLVGAGVLLATALGFSVTDALGLTGAEDQFSGKPIMLVLLPVIAVIADLLTARLEQAAAQDPDKDGE